MGAPDEGSLPDQTRYRLMIKKSWGGKPLRNVAFVGEDALLDTMRVHTPKKPEG